MAKFLLFSFWLLLFFLGSVFIFHLFHLCLLLPPCLSLASISPLPLTRSSSRTRQSRNNGRKEIKEMEEETASERNAEEEI